MGKEFIDRLNCTPESEPPVAFESSPAKSGDDGHMRMLESLRKYDSAHRQQQKERRRKIAAQPPYPEQARALREWWDSTGSTRYRNVASFAECIEVWPALMWSYFGGRVRPAHDRRAKLFELTQLNCFAPEPDRAEWIEDFETQARIYIEHLPADFSTKKKYREWVRHILDTLASAGVTASNDIRPDKLLQNPPNYKPQQTKRVAMSFMAEFLMKLGMWTPVQNEDFKMALRQFYPHSIRETARAPKQPIKRSALDSLIVSLVTDGGLGVQQILKLRLTQIEPLGIRLGPRRLLQFGENSHQILKAKLDAYLSESKPQNVLFYSFRPPDYNRPLSSKPIHRIMREFDPGTGAGIPVETVHFKNDFQLIPNPRRLRPHFRYFHDLSGSQTWKMMKKFYTEAKTFVLPKPYVLAILCASRLLRETASRQVGGKTFIYTWFHLGGYDVTATWPVSLYEELQDQRKRARIARLLLRFGQHRWADSGGLAGKRKSQALSRLMEYWGKSKHPMGRKVNRPKLLTDDVNQFLVDRLQGTRIEIRDTSNNLTWAGPLLKRTRKGPLLPLVDQLEGGPTNPRCPICGHPNRDAIDAAIRSGQSSIATVARKYALAYGPENHQVLWHAGRLTGNGSGHLGVAPASPIVRIPITFLTEMSRANGTELAARLLLSVGVDENTTQLIVLPR